MSAPLPEAVSRTQWAWLSGEDRARHLFAFAHVLTGHVDALAVSDAPALLDAAFSAAGWADKTAVLGITPAAGVVALDHDERTDGPELLTRAVAHLAGGRAVVLRPRPTVVAFAASLVLAATEAGLPEGLLSAAPTTEPLAATPRPAADVVLAGADPGAVAAHLLTVLAAGADARPDGTRVLVVEDVATALLTRLDGGAAALGLRSVRSATEALAVLTATPATELTVWGERPAGVHRWRSLEGVVRLGIDAAALPDHRSTALAVLRGRP